DRRAGRRTKIRESIRQRDDLSHRGARMKTITIILLLTLVACSKQRAAESVDQLVCIGKTEARETLALYAAGCIDERAEPTGACSDEQIDAITTPTTAEGEACLTN